MKIAAAIVFYLALCVGIGLVAVLGGTYAARPAAGNFPAVAKIA
jgi:hypothetical protein